MFDSTINKIGMWIISGKYVLMVLLAGITFYTGPTSSEMLAMHLMDAPE